MDPATNPSDVLWRERLAQAHLFHTREKVLLLDALKARFGQELPGIVARTVEEEAFRTWRAIGETQTDRSAENLVRLLWEPLRVKGFDFEVIAAGGEVRLRCTRCPIAEMAQALGGREWLFHLACGIDEAIARGFNPSLALRRTRTLMEGHDCCDHVYLMDVVSPSRPE